ncbi:MAG: alpha-amylase [Chloroflexi bacterium]|nr:alpha-amylase [Chloroflexota bacterium]
MHTEFPISRRARDRYSLDHWPSDGDAYRAFKEPVAARLLADRMNRQQDTTTPSKRAVTAGQIHAVGLIMDIQRHVVRLYEHEVGGNLLGRALGWLIADVGQELIDTAIEEMSDAFPSMPVFRDEIALDMHLRGEPDGRSHRELALGNLVLVWLANMNPAFAPLIELFDDSELRQKTAYLRIVASLHSFLDTLPPFGPDQQNLLDMMRSPAIAVPHSLYGQLEYIHRHWGYLLAEFLYRLLIGLDLIKEEEHLYLPGPGPSQVYDFRGHEFDAESFSPDRDWMPHLVLLAKNTYVWLDQLSRQYGRTISRLDQIPDDELDLMARRGFTGLWLIGLWERSPASQRVKQLCGNPEAVASAYSLFDYEIAVDLGGAPAFEDLKSRAWRRGIRLASDMVPNHMGIDSRWVIDHPDWFIGLDHSPYPSYTFDGPNLSGHQQVGIYLEDHYYTRSDAAIVFKRVNFGTGKSRYIYHGNDGTSMPWNDTAQLDYLKPEVREAVIQTILRVARQFPVIRFDAAMTLTKKHYQRLWFPEPGSGGDIPTRAEHGMTQQEFDAHMPKEFWREVVDRVQVEAPDTLLLAEAFWLMETYFVRTLGMHRVYNSAFMNMLREEENAKYRRLIKNTLEFDPQILKRFVNFMNNPDERTAIDQYGRGDKYFGICTLLATMPGLPMIGHGQVEGFTEKYGMEYRRAYWDEHPDAELVERHELEIFPLLRRRHLFAEADHFLLYDFITHDGHTNEDVYAYSNCYRDERALVVYHNRYAETSGRIHFSAPISDPGASDGENREVSRSLTAGLGLQEAPGVYTTFHDLVTGLEYIRSNEELRDRGLYIELKAYERHVFLNFREIQDSSDRYYARLTQHLNGRGAPSLEDALQELLLQPIHLPFVELVDPAYLDRLIDTRSSTDSAALQAIVENAEQRVARVLTAIADWEGRSCSPADSVENRIATIARQVSDRLRAALSLPNLDVSPATECSGVLDNPATMLLTGLLEQQLTWYTLLDWVFVHSLDEVLHSARVQNQSIQWHTEWRLGPILVDSLCQAGISRIAAQRAVRMVRILTRHRLWFTSIAARERHANQVLVDWLSDEDIREYLHLNRYEGILWFNKESFEELIWWMHTVAVIVATTSTSWPTPDQVDHLMVSGEIVSELAHAHESSSYRVDTLLEALKH